MSSTLPDQKSTILVLRSLANSRKEASLADLVRDYAETEGGQIPFARFGYRRLEDFLKESGEFRVTPWQTVQVRTTDVSSHINKFVAEQKSTPTAASRRHTKILPQRQVHQAARTQSPTVYSNAFQNMKLRSPVKQHYGGGAAYNRPYQLAANPTANHQQQQQTQSFHKNAPVGNNNWNQTSNGGANNLNRQNSQQDGNPKDRAPRTVPYEAKPRQKAHSPIRWETKPVADLRQKITQKSPPQSPPPQLPMKSNDKPLPDLRQKLNRKAFNEAPPQTPPSPTPKAVTPPAPHKKSSTKTSFVLRSTAEVFRPLNVGTVLSQQQQQQPIPYRDAAPIVEPAPISRLQQRLRITPAQDHIRAAAIEPTTPPVPTTPPAPTVAEPTPTRNPHVAPSYPVVRSKLSDRLIQRPTSQDAAPPRKITPPTPPADGIPIVPSYPPPSLASGQPAGYPYTKPPPPLGTDKTQKEPITALARYSKSLGFGIPEYKILRMPKTNRIQCRVMINNVSYSSYPHDFETMREAKLFTAVETLVQLRQQQQQQRYPVCMDLESELVAKLFDCLKESAHGMFLRNIPDLFQEIHRQSLPEHWETLMMKTPHLFTFSDSIDNTQIVYANHGDTNEAMSNPAAQSPRAKTDHTHASLERAMSDVDLGTKPAATQAIGADTEESSNSQTMEKLVLPWNEKYWNVFITNPKSTVEIWARLIGAEYSDLMDNLIVDIELDLMQNRIRPSTVKVGHVYLVVVSECTYRVRVDRLDFAQSRCLCFYIDNGDEEWFPLDQIYVCKAQFLAFPPQAICLGLFGLEDCAENPNAQTHLDAVLTNKTLIADVASKRVDYEMQEASVDETARIVVALYDTSSEEDVQLNNVILDRICEDCVLPTLRPIGITNVQIGHVTNDGEVFCQLRTNSGGIHYVQKLIHHLVQFGFNPDQHRYAAGDEQVTRMVGGEPRPAVFLVQDVDDRKWYRASIVRKVDGGAGAFVMFYVDVGMTRTVPMDSVYRLDSMCVVLYKYPFQAIACRLYEVHDMTATMVASLRCYLNQGTSAVFKVMASRNKVPFVKIFIRYQEGPLVCINDTIQLEEEIENTSEIIDDSASIFGTIITPQSPAISSRPPSSNGHQHQPKSQQRMQALPKYEFPRVGDTFQLHVTMASNPYNFKVQPHRQIPAFQQLMLELQEYCTRTPAYVPDADVQMGEVYACQQDDNVWYRAIVQNVCSSSMFLISYCDYGDIVVVNSDRLKVLPAQFRQLPALAIKAKLFGVTPKNQDWETEDCLQFQRMCVDKKFVSIVHKVDQVGASDDDVQLELTLIDVSTDTDIDINSMLVLEDRAVANIVVV